MLVAVVALFGVLALAAASALSAARQDLTSAKADLQVARRAMVAGNRETAEQALTRAGAHIAAARSPAKRFPLVAVRPLPLLGSPAAALVDVANAGDELVAAGRVLVEARSSFPISATAALNGRDLSPFHAATVESRVKLDAARRHVAAARAAARGPSGAVLPAVSRLAKRVLAEIDQAQRELDGWRRGLEVLAQLTGPTADLRLLVLSQDSLELRPTGGYIGSYGVLRFSAGTVSLERYESTEVLPEPVPHMSPPRELEAWLPRWWGLSNVNWWPNFPTTADTAKEMFRRQGGGDVHGVIALTEHAVARLVGILGPLHVPGYSEPVVEEGFARRVLYEVELKRPLDQPRKKFLAELSKVLFARLFDLDAGKLPAVSRAVDRSVGAGDVQVWFADPALQDLVVPTGWSGRLPAAKRDFVMLVDSNMSGSKANLDLVKEASYRVHRRDDGWVRARLDITVRNQGEEDPILNPYYNGFLRLYLPTKARVPTLHEGQRRHGGAEDAPYQVVSQVLDIAPLAQQKVLFQYWLPPSVAPDGRYELTWLRQAGTPRDTLTVMVDGRSIRGNPADRSLEVRADLGDSRIREFLRDRWVVQKLRGLLSVAGMDPSPRTRYAPLKGRKVER